MKYNYLNQYFKLQKYIRVFTGEIIPSASLKLTWLTQRTQVRFRRHITLASLKEKFLGEISGFRCQLPFSAIRFRIRLRNSGVTPIYAAICT